MLLAALYNRSGAYVLEGLENDLKHWTFKIARVATVPNE